MDVNKYWMCDYGRLDTFKYINDEETRLNSPLMRPPEGGILNDEEYNLVKCDWDDAIARVISELKSYEPGEIGFIASPFSTLEDNYVLKRFANEIAGKDNIVYIPKIEGSDDDFLIRADKTPNSKGLDLLGLRKINKEFKEKILNGKFKLIYIINDTLTRLEQADEMMKKIEVGIMHVSNMVPSNKKATVVFPSSTYAEVNGTVVNFQGRVQRLRPAVATLEVERLLGEFSVSRWDKFGAQNDKWARGTKFNSRPVWKVITQMANAMGFEFDYENTEDVFDEIAAKLPEFSGMSYDTIGSCGLAVGQGEKVSA